MMLPAQGPTTTLTEDMDALFGPSTVTEGKSDPDSKIKQVKKADAEGGDYAGKPGDKQPGDPGGDVDLDTGDDAAGHYTYVPGRGDEDVGPGGKYGRGRGGAKNEDYEEVASLSGKMVPSFMIPPTPSVEEVAEAEERLAEQAATDQLNNAWEVINAYFSEDEDGLNEDGLRGVINALGHALNVAVEDIAMLQSENVRLTEAVNDLNGLLREAEESMPFGGKQAAPFGKKDDEDEDEEEEEDEEKSKKDDEDEEKGKKMPSWMKQESRRGGNLMEDASLNSILDEVAAIGGSPRQQALNAQEALVNAFESVVESASDILGRVVDVIREDEGLAEDEEIELPGDDQRLKVAQYFYGIAEDAQNYLARLADGDVAFRVAEEDLNRLHGDIQKGIDAMHKIPA